ncbi:hypothetical protein [Frankia sp. AgB32]|uniref:hypothetical protein n=1 Tax=Frankia sp. AgB32 TaxID=631119 RepID=UPI00200F8258|nr:hypothetical protein [Frankia sp. AgB32]MCK9895202.1 hypothetical protein [Frankia sp. AgB32]
MELLLLWALTYAIVHASRQTWRHGRTALFGQPQPDARPDLAAGLADGAADGVQAAAGGAARVAGSVWQALGDGWRAGWAQGRSTRAARGRWRPWEEPTVWVTGPGPGRAPRDEPPSTPTPPPPPSAAGGPTTGAGRRRPADAATGDGDGGRVAPRCWSELPVDEQLEIVDQVRASGRSWADLSVTEAADAVRRHLRARHGLWRVSRDDILTAQARHDDPTWRTGPPPTTPPPTPTPAPASASAGNDDNIVDAEIVAPRCWSQLAPDEQQQIADGAAATGRKLADLPDAERHQLIADWISRTYRTDLTATDVAAAQAAQDAQAMAGCTECTAADRDGRPASARAADHRLGCPTGRFLAERAAGYTGWLDQDGRRVDPADAPAPFRTTPDDEADSSSPDPTSPTPALVAHTPTAPAVGIPTHEGELTIMTAGSGETTNIQAARTYYEQLAGHAESDIASRIEMSRTYMTAAQLSDTGVLSAIAHAQETAGLLAAASRGVVSALEAHRLMEEAVASTPGAANTDFYRPA